MPRPPLVLLTLALTAAFALPAAGQDDPAGSPAADAPQQEVTPDEKTDDENPPTGDPAPPAGEDANNGTASADPPADADAGEPAAEPTPELLVENLETPTGLALSPQSGDVFVATRWGVYRYVPQTHAIFLEVEGYDVPDTMGEDGEFKIGPLSLAFQGDSELVVGGGSEPAGEELVQTFEIGLEPRGDDPQIRDTDVKQSAGPVDAATAGGEGAGNFVGTLVGEKGVYVSTSGTTPKGWILKVPTDKGEFGPIEPFLATADVAGVGGPGPMAWDGDGNLVVGLWGGPMPGDDVISVFTDAGELKGTFKADIGEFGGLAYHPKTGELYATDMGLSTDRGGLYKVKLEGEKAVATKVLALDKPAGILFDADGKLYLTTLGTAEPGKTTPDGDEFSPGALHLIEEGL